MQNSTEVDELLDPTSSDQTTDSLAPSASEHVDFAPSQAAVAMSPRARWSRQAGFPNWDATVVAQNLTGNYAYSSATISSCWRTSTTHALLQKFTRQVLSEKQVIIHTVTLGWTIPQYMSHYSNPFASTFKYSLMDDTGYSVHTTSADHSRNHDLPAIDKGSQSVNGMARFLDAFADIYGNPLDREARNDALDALDAVTHAWSTQWLFDADGEGLIDSADLFSKDTLLRAARHREFYAEGWFNAHRLLVKTRHSPSFIRILAVFLFNMAEIPECAVSCVQPGETPIELQEHALLQSRALLSLVYGFAKALPPNSMHRTLLESACSVMHWYGYVRDTSVALMYQRGNILDTVELDRGHHLAAAPSNLLSIDANVEALCQAAAARIIGLKRSIITIRDPPHRLGRDIESSPTDPFALFDQIDAFNTGTGARLVDLLANNGVQSPRMDGCISHLLLSWNYGVLALIQCIRGQPALINPGEMESLEVKMNDIGERTISYVSSLAVRFAASSVSKDDCDSRESLYPPLIARNGNIPLVTAMLVDFVEHAVMTTTHESAEIQRPDEGVFEIRSSRVCHDPVPSLLKSLLSLTRTMGGSSGPRTALQSLMARYPDELMGVWTTEVVK